VDLLLFEEVDDALRAMVPAELGEPRCRARRYGIKVWFGSEQSAREHYEAQVIGAKYDDAATTLALEVGFHAEHPRVAENDAVIAHLMTTEKRWRRVVGNEAVVGPFLGRADTWRRVSETWPDPDLSDAALVVEVAARLTDYVIALEPARRGRET
jgi:hypothetical protein